MASTAPVPAQSKAAQADPANLTGERVAAPELVDDLAINHGVPALQQLLRKLRTRASFLLIVAHPDDEDSGALTYLSRGQGARVAMLTLTRGEGGQNLMSADFDDALGLIRTQELLAEDRYTGADQFFGTEVDFGFSKTKEETLAKWTHERVLYDAVRVVRLYRPLVIASVFVGGPTDGHGHHQVAGEIAQEVFDAAGDPKVFPEMGLAPWTPLKVYARAPFARIDAQGMYDYATGKYSQPRFYNYVTKTWSDAPPKANVLIPEGEVSTALGMDGMSYVQFARKGLALQKSQIGAGSRGGGGGAFDVGYARYGSHLAHVAEHEATLFDGIDVTFAGIADLAPSMPAKFRAMLAAIDAKFADAQSVFDPANPGLTAPPLRDALRALDGILKELEDERIDDLPATEKADVLHELRVKRVQCNNALVLALGVQASARLASEAAGDVPLTPGSKYAVRMEVSRIGNEPLVLDRAALDVVSGLKASTQPAAGVVSGTPLAAGKALSLAWDAALPFADEPTEPYFHPLDVEQAAYRIDDTRLRNAPETPAPLTARLFFTTDGVPVEVARTVASGAATSKEAAMIVPRLSTDISPGVTVVSTASGEQRPIEFKVRVRTNVPNERPRVEIAQPKDWKITQPKEQWTLEHVGDSHSVAATVVPTGIRAGQGLDGKPSVRAFAIDPSVGETKTSNLGYRRVGYPGLKYTNYYRPADLRVVGVDVKTAPGLKAGYLPGTGDSVAEFLPDLGVVPTMLTEADLTAAGLAKFDVVVLGVRAYAAHPALAGAGSRPLMDYASNGGVVIVQYNTARYGDGEAPYPIAVPGSSEFNVVEEADPVRLLAPESPVLTWPNRITAADFDHWVEERGHGFARSWAAEYEPLLEMHDPGQDEEKGGLLVAHVGKGYYVYTALALYRQLPEGVPGAYRILANLLSMAKNPRLFAAP
jgi:LmbE family N-acetylglucosaminyl deacetylase